MCCGRRPAGRKGSRSKLIKAKPSTSQSNPPVNLDKLNDLVNEVTVVYNSNLDWEKKYELIFGIHNHRINPLIQDSNLSFTWEDPNSTYQADVIAYYVALLGIMK